MGWIGPSTNWQKPTATTGTSKTYDDSSTTYDASGVLYDALITTNVTYPTNWSSVYNVPGNPVTPPLPPGPPPTPPTPFAIMDDLTYKMDDVSQVMDSA